MRGSRKRILKIAVSDADVLDDIAGIVRERGGKPLDLHELHEYCGMVLRGRRAYGDDRGYASDQEQHGLIWPSATIPGTGVQLHAPTIAARLLLARAVKWLDARTISERLHLWFCAYVLAHARDAEALAAVKQRSQIDAVLEDWALRLTCTDADIAAALDQVQAGAYPDTPGTAEKKKAPGQTGPGS